MPDQPTVSKQDAVDLALMLGVPYKENSASKGIGTREVLETAIRLAVDHIKRQQLGFFQRTKARLSSKKNSKQLPPDPPPAGSAPQIQVSMSTFAEDWQKMLEDRSCTDVKFIISGSLPVEAHKVILTAASPLFTEIFTGESNSQWYKKVFEDITWACDAGDNCINLEHSKRACSSGKTVITLNPSISSSVFHQVMLFLYTGLTDMSEDADKEFVGEIKSVAEKFQFSLLSQVCENLFKGEAYLNPSIGTWQNHNTGATMKELFLNKEPMSDIKFHVENTTLYAHRAVLTARCDVTAAMLGGAFRESCTNEVEVKDTCAESFLAILEYLYTDHAPIEECDPVDIMKLADRFCLPRLVALCELYITKAVDKTTREHVSDRASNVIHLLLTSQAHNANQLTDWCLHFISTNYSVIAEVEEFSLLQEEHRLYVEEHRWPPLSYMEALKKYKKAASPSKAVSKCKVM